MKIYRDDFFLLPTQSATIAQVRMASATARNGILCLESEARQTSVC